MENGIKYTDRGIVSLQVERHEDHMTVHVRDTCPGLSAEELAVIFEPFRRGRSAKQGSGLGLAIVKQAVAALGGEVQAESPGDRGCHFWFTIPGVES